MKYKNSNSEKLDFPKAIYAKSSLIIIFFSFSLMACNALFNTANKTPKKSYVATIYTKFGQIDLLLFDKTPKHRDNFIKLIEEDFYDSTTFHRVLDNFMIQGGDPNSKPNASAEVGTGGPGYTIESEILEGYKHNRGMLAAARKGDRVNPERASSGSQFYIVQNESGAHHLDGAYTIFGTVLNGLDVVDEIASVTVDRKGKPEEVVRMSISVKKMKRKNISEEFEYEFSD